MRLLDFAVVMSNEQMFLKIKIFIQTCPSIRTLNIPVTLDLHSIMIFPLFLFHIFNLELLGP